MREWMARLFDWTRRDRLERELAEEMEFHRRQLERDAIADGATPQQARDEARRRLGNRTRIAEESRERWSWPVLDAVLQDARYALRGLRRAPGFTAAVVLTLSLGIGANAAMFGVIDRLMFRPLGHLRDPGTVHLVYLRSMQRGSPRTSTWVTSGRYRDLAQGTTSFAQVAAFNERTIGVQWGDDVREMRVGAVSASYFSLFDARPVLGRFIGEEDDQPPAGSDVVVISHALWQSEYGGSGDVLGKRLRIGSMDGTIVGVAPEGLAGVNDADPPVMWIPISAIFRVRGLPASAEGAGYNLFLGGMLVRRKPGVTVEQANADLTQAFARSWENERAVSRNPQDRPPAAQAGLAAFAAGVRPGQGPEKSLESRTALWVGGVAVIVLLIACANVANLFLWRALRRGREHAVRLALGVSRVRLVGQAVTESLVLALLGALGGLLVAQWGGAAIRRLLMPGASAPLDALGDWRTVAATVAVALLAGLLTSIAPATIGRRGDLASTLRSGGARGSTARRSRVRDLLLVVQGALSVALLVGAALFVRSLQAAKASPLGYDAQNVLLVRQQLAGARLAPPARDALRESLLQAARTLPGVEGAAWIATVPFGMTASMRITVPGVDSIAQMGLITSQETTPDYFQVMRTRILRGRGFTSDDRAGAPGAIIVSEGLARALWPGQEAVGQCVIVGPPGGPCSSVVGVAEDMVQESIRADRQLHFYLPWGQQPAVFPGLGMVLRLRGDPAVEGEAIRRELMRVMPGGAYLTIEPLREMVDGAYRPWRFGATMFTAFGVLALLVAAVGLYGVIGYDVSQRMHELGVRVALGARAGDLLRMVVGQGVRFTVVGIVIGAALALFAARWLEPLLFGQSARDPAVYASVAATLLLVALAACVGPAVRATRADPNVALRVE